MMRLVPMSLGRFFFNVHQFGTQRGASVNECRKFNTSPYRFRDGEFASGKSPHPNDGFYDGRNREPCIKHYL